MMIPSGRVRCWKLKLAISLAIGISIFSSKNLALAQVAPDTTLGSERSVVKPLNPLVDQIDGGARRGVNLFHSFQEFNVGEGRGAYFTNPVGIENIFSRVTGSTPSNILGKLGVLGNANLFLINPNGIIFGRNASLDVKGSFVGTTANAIHFDNQGFFSASTPNVPPVLTVNPSALLFNQIATGTITNNSKVPAGERLDPDPSDPSRVRSLFGLRVPDGRSLLLVGGDVNLTGGGLNALGGRVELGGVARSGMIGLDVNGNNLSLSFPNGAVQANIFLTKSAVIDTSGEGSGNIRVQGKRITLSGGSQIIADTLGSKSGGALILTASDSVNLFERTRGGLLSSRTSGTGDAGDLTISTRKLIIQGGAQVLTSTSGKGSGGKLTVNASESVELIGTSPGGAASSLSSATISIGNAGDLTINTGKLIARDGARVSAESSGIEDSSGNFTPATGKGGALTVNASNSVELIGTDAEGSPSGLFATTEATGAAGNIKINTGQLIVRDGALVDVGSEGTKPAAGAAGNLEVRARSIHLDNGAALRADTIMGQGNIYLGAQDLVLRHGSQITTSATGTATGGNITIKTGVLTALENSDISANADEGPGGRVKVNASGIFGTEFRHQDTPLSDITATSALGPQFSGTVQINTLVNNPSFGLVNLPVQPVDVKELIAQGCPGNIGPRGSKFVVTGRGGLPPTPREALASEPPLADLGTTVPGQENRASAATATTNLINSESAPIVEATGWVTNAKGEVMLVANPPTFTPDIPWMAPTSCHTQ